MRAISLTKNYKCTECKAVFIKERLTQKICLEEACAVAVAKKNKVKREKVARKETKVKLEALQPKSYYTGKAQIAVNAFIRARDAGNPCISCGRHHQGAWHAGHYRSTGAAPELRFEELNIHLQCAPCNTHLSGNIVNYRPRLIEKIGLQGVDWVEGKHAAKNYTKDDLREIEATYKAKLKTLQIKS